jgi:hypothetical protein
MSQEIQHALDAAMALAVEHNQSRARLWLPHLSSAWLGVAPRYVLLDSAQDEVAAARDDERDLSSAEASQGVRETEYDAENMKKTPHASPFTLRIALLREAWSSRRSLKMRLALSGMIRSVRESPHIKHALKNAAGVAALTFPAFLPRGSVGECTYDTTDTPHIQVALRQDLVLQRPWTVDGHHLLLDSGDDHRCDMALWVSPHRQSHYMTVALFISWAIE